MNEKATLTACRKVQYSLALEKTKSAMPMFVRPWGLVYSKYDIIYDVRLGIDNEAVLTPGQLDNEKVAFAIGSLGVGEGGNVEVLPMPVPMANGAGKEDFWNFLLTFGAEI